MVTDRIKLSDRLNATRLLQTKLSDLIGSRFSRNVDESPWVPTDIIQESSCMAAPIGLEFLR